MILTVQISTINTSLDKDKRVNEHLLDIEVEAENELEGVHSVAMLKRSMTYPLLRNEGTVVSYKIKREEMNETQNS